MPEQVTLNDPDDKAETPGVAHDTMTDGAWQGPTYYRRSQLKAAPFGNWVVGGYIFCAGLAGASALISTIAGFGRLPQGAGMVRRGRYLALLGPLSAVLLVYDLHTPKRFYNMLRIAKPTSPMSIGTWILMSFSGFAGISAAAQFLSDRVPGLGWMRRAARVTDVPAAVAGAGLSTYTASLLSATSTPLWAAAPRSLAVRFGASSVAAGAASLSLGERSGATRRALDAVTVAALAAELAATLASHEMYRRKGVAEALDGGWGHVEKVGVTGWGTALPLGLQLASFVLARRKPGVLSDVASVAVLAGSLLLRVSMLSVGDRSAERPGISFRFSQPENLP
jgi:formate-dependent nitrite reductase membrane component NrfD